MRNLKWAAAATTSIGLSGSAAMAGDIIPMPVAGVGGYVALVAAVALAGLYKFFRGGQK
jgi:hypothetical protein